MRSAKVKFDLLALRWRSLAKADVFEVRAHALNVEKNSLGSQRSGTKYPNACSMFVVSRSMNDGSFHHSRRCLGAGPRTAVCASGSRPLTKGRKGARNKKVAPAKMRSVLGIPKRARSGGKARGMAMPPTEVPSK